MTRPGRRRRRTAVAVSSLVLVGVAGLSAVSGASTSGASARAQAVPPPGVPITHVIIVDQENHTFDQMLGRICVEQNSRCNGVTSGLAGTTVVPLAPAADIVPAVDHSVAGQATATDGGKMDGFYRLSGCTAPSYGCYTAATDAEIPTLKALMTNFAVSDNTFSQAPEMSWEQHLRLGTLTNDGFNGNNPTKDPTLTGGTGWGCNSPDRVKWGPTGQYVSPCIPDQNGLGPRKPSPVPYVKNFYTDVLAANSISYKLYGACYASGTCFGANNTNENIWCLGCGIWAWRGNAAQVAASARHPQDILSDLKTSNLPQVSFVIPTPGNSQHNNDSLTVGDNWLGSIVTSAEQSPYWASTVIVIGYDDCGCFYDHVAPPAGLGMRTPLVIVSPYAKPGYVDSTQAAFAPASLALVEWVFGLPTLTPTSADNGAYAWQNSLDFNQVPLPPVALKTSAIPAASQRYLASHPISQTADPDS